MDLSGYRIPDDLRYTKEHEWAREVGGTVRVGVTDYAAKTLNDVVYVTLPKKGDKVQQLKSMGTLESIKAVSELYSPLSGEVVSVNDGLLTHPELVNKSPYGEGWLLDLKPSALVEERMHLLDARGYTTHLETILKG